MDISAFMHVFSGVLDEEGGGGRKEGRKEGEEIGGESTIIEAPITQS